MDKNKIIIVVVLATIFGFSSGIVGFIVTRTYLFTEVFNIPMFGEINLMGNNPQASGLVISGAKKVVVEQNTKVIDTINSAQQNIVGIFNEVDLAIPASQEKNQEKNLFDLSKMYNLSEPKAKGIILTSDGWIISNFTPLKLIDLKSTSTDVIKKELSAYRIISANKNIYTPINIIIDSVSGYSFWRVQANDLPVKKIINDNEIKNGQLVLAVNWAGKSFLTSILSQEKNKNAILQSSDEYINRLTLNIAPKEEFYSNFLFNLNGDLAGLISDKGVVMSAGSFAPCISCLLKNRKITRPFLGINYINLEKYLDETGVLPSAGALIYKDKNGVSIVKGSPAEKAGLKEGDLIVMINNIELKNGNILNQIINNYEVGQEISLKYLRDNIEKEIKIKLGKK